MLRRLIPDPFLVLLLGTVLFASYVPARGEFASIVDKLSIIAVTLLFFFHGAKLAREQVISGLANWRLHLVVLACTFVFFPVVGMAGEYLFHSLLKPGLWLGILFICALPSTVQSSIAFVSLARGNVSAAIASASASQLFGIVLTPILMQLMSGLHSSYDLFAGISKIAIQIFLPFMMGHMLRPVIGRWVDRNRRVIGYTDYSAIVITVFGAFSAAVVDGIWQTLSPSALAMVVVVNGVLLTFALCFTWGLGRAFGFNREDRIAIQFCGTKKSLVQGVPVARVLFAGPQVGLILLPLMLFHQMQLMACAFLARSYLKRQQRIEEAGGASIESQTCS